VGHVGRRGRLWGFVRVYVVRLWPSLRVVPMAVDPTPLECAFVLAPNWELYRAQIRDQLDVEGYAVSQLVGRTLMKQSFVPDCSNDRFPPRAAVQTVGDARSHLIPTNNEHRTPDGGLNALTYVHRAVSQHLYPSI